MPEGAPPPAEQFPQPGPAGAAWPSAAPGFDVAARHAGPPSWVTPAVPPDPHVPRGRRWAVAASLAVILLAGGAITAFVLLQPSHHTPVVVPQRSTTTSSTTPTTGSSSSTVANPGLAEAQSLEALLAQSSSDRSEILAATADIASCGDFGQDQATLESAAQSRQALLTQLSQLDLSQLPDAGSLVSTLTSAWQASLQSDGSYAAWAGDLEGTGCSGQASTTDANLQAAQVSDTQATTAKSEFVAGWNPIAATYGLSQFTAKDI